MSPVVRLGHEGTEPYDLLLAMGAGAVSRRPGGAPRVGRGHASVARTAGMAAAALAGTPVGIDVELVRPLPDLEALVDDHLGPADAARVRGAVDPVVAFHEVWVGLEAVLKAEGTGIVDGLDPADEVRARWRVVPLAAGPSHRAALAVAAR